MARPKGSPNKRQAIEHFFKEKDIKEFIEFLKDNYKEDSKLMIWLGDHLFGKVQAKVDVTSGGEKLPTPILGGIVPSDETAK